MKTQILERLAELEKQHQFEVLYACESGSRSWGFASTNSDYDVRFIYRKTPCHYFQLQTPKTDTVTDLGPVLDFHGWDIRKALNLLVPPNATLLEWIYAPIVYKPWKYLDEVRQIATMNKKASIYHYIAMAENNFKRYILPDEVECSMKKYLYVIRPVLCCLWILDRGTMPPVPFKDLLVYLPQDLYPPVTELLAKKMSGEELSTGKRMPAVDAWVLSQISEVRSRVDDLPNQPRTSYDRLNQIYREVAFENIFGHPNIE